MECTHPDGSSRRTNITLPNHASTTRIQASPLPINYFQHHVSLVRFPHLIHAFCPELLLFVGMEHLDGLRSATSPGHVRSRSGRNHCTSNENIHWVKQFSDKTTLATASLAPAPAPPTAPAAAAAPAATKYTPPNPVVSARSSQSIRMPALKGR